MLNLKILNLHGDLPFLAERKMKKCNKLVCNINDKENYVAKMFLKTLGRIKINSE